MKFISEEELADRLKLFSIDPKTLEKIDLLNKQLKYEEHQYDDVFPNLFIFGIQRSGTTLLNQVLAMQQDFGYINNLIARFWENPQYGVYLSNHLNMDREISFTSRQGTTSNVSDVHEFGYFWASLLGHKSSPMLGENDLSKIDWNLLLNKILSINHAYQKPCVFKNTLIGHYLENMNELFASPLFIYIKRDYLDTACSILKARNERYGNTETWWSMKPREYDEIKNLGVHEQIVAQMYYLHEDMKRQLPNVPESNLIEIDYKNLCHDPNEVLSLIQKKLKGLGHDVELESKSFQLKYSTVSKSNEDVKQFEQHLKKYFG